MAVVGEGVELLLPLARRFQHEPGGGEVIVVLVQHHYSTAIFYTTSHASIACTIMIITEHVGTIGVDNIQGVFELK